VLSAPRVAAQQFGKMVDQRFVFRPLNAGGDAAAQRPYHDEQFLYSHRNSFHLLAAWR
jgi:hypothetical protein